MADYFPDDLPDDLGFLWHSSPPVSITVNSLLEAQEEMRQMGPRVQWRENQAEASREDMGERRGILALNPDIKGLAEIDPHGMITERNGVEYRVVVDDYMRGMKDPEGGTIWGMWIEPMPPLRIEPLVQWPGEEWARLWSERFIAYGPLTCSLPSAYGMDILGYWVRAGRSGAWYWELDCGV